MRLTLLLFPVAAQVLFLTNGIGLYIHIPFCESKCSYCNFYSFKCGEQEKDAYLKRLISEIEKWGAEISRPIFSVYIGGGTPTTLGGERLSRILSAVNRCFDVLPDAEITVEGNPADDYGNIAPLIAKAGCNRVSLGVQSAIKNELSVLGRRHKNDDVLSAVATLRSNGITNISVDLMLGLPESNKESLKNSIDFVLSLDVPHISAYILKLESGTPLHKTAPPLPNDDEVSEQYLMLCQMLKQNGYEHYEISNFAKKDMHSRHNSAYWECKEYLGLGPAAHSFLSGKRFYYPADLKEYIKSPTPVPDGEGGGKYEYIMLGLRLKKGISAAEFKDKTGSDLPEGIMKKAIQLKNSGICDINGDRISLSDEGMLVSNAVINYFTEEL